MKDYLHETYELLVCAFPDGIPEEQYIPLLAILHPEMSFRTIAEVLSSLMQKSYIEIYNDASGFGLDLLPDSEQIEKVRERLVKCGYEQWH